MFSIGGEYNQYIALQIHGGCDVRGGYTRPRIFALTEEFSIMHNADGQIYCTGTGEEPWENRHEWSTNDAYSWYYQGTAGHGAGKQLEKYPIIDKQDLLDEVSETFTEDLEDYLAGKIADMISQSGLAECIREYRDRYNAADLDTEIEEDKLRAAEDILIYKRLIELNDEDLASTLALDLPGGKDKIDLLEDNMKPYQREIDRQNRRKQEIQEIHTKAAIEYSFTEIPGRYTEEGKKASNDYLAKIDYKNFSYRAPRSLVDIMTRHQKQRQSEIDSVNHQREQYKQDRGFILADGDQGFCPLCQSTLVAQ